MFVTHYFLSSHAYNCILLQGLNNPEEHETQTHGSHKRTYDAGGCVYPLGADPAMVKFRTNNFTA